MRPIDLLSSRYYSIKPKGHDGGSSRWRARPVMAAAILLLMSLAVLLPAMVLAQTADQAPTDLTAVPGDAEGSIQLDWEQSTDTNIDSYEYTIREKGTTQEFWDEIPNSACCDPEATLSENDDSYEITTGGRRTVGLTYEVKIRAVDTNNDEGPESETVEVKAGPAAVAGLTATSGHQSVTLSWMESTDSQVTRYEYRSKAGASGAWSNWANTSLLGATTTDQTITGTKTGLNNGREYTFQVRAYINQPTETPPIDAAGGAGAEVTVTPGAPAALGTVTAVPGYQRIRLEWADPMGSGITYEYGVALTPVDDSSTVAWKSASVVKYTNAGGEMVALLVDMTTGTDGADPEVPAAALLDNTSYTLYLRAVNRSGNGPVSEATASTLGATADPATPANPTASPGDESVTLSWDAVINYAGVGYQYCKDTTANQPVGNCVWDNIDNSNFTTTSYTVEGLTNGTPYYFRVRAISNADTAERTAADPLVRVSGASAETPAVTPGLPSAPTNLKAIPGDAKFRLSWTASAANGSAITEYQYNTDGDGWKPIADSGTSALITKTSAAGDIDLGIDQTYAVQLRAVNSNGTSAESEELSVTTNDDPPAPTGLTATPGPDSGEVTLKWTAPVYLDISGYQYSSAINVWADLPDGTTTSATVDMTSADPQAALENGAPYTFNVRAMNGTVAGAALATGVAVTPGVPTAPKGPDGRIQAGGNSPQLDCPHLHWYAHPYQVRVPVYQRSDRRRAGLG